MDYYLPTQRQTRRRRRKSYGLVSCLILSCTLAVKTNSIAIPEAATTRETKFPTSTANIALQRPELDPWREYDQLRGGLDTSKLQDFFSSRPHKIASRLVKVATTLKRTKDEWEAAEVDPSFAGDGNFDFTYTSENDDDDTSTGTKPDRGAKLCERMSSLGPVAVKIAQTLSQRPDLVGDEACNALKRLQTSNTPFDDNIAMAIIKESLNWTGPVAPGMGEDEDNYGKKQDTLFAWMSEKPIAVASLGQVYKARTHDGTQVAVKVQRPDGMALLATDFTCFKLVLGALDSIRKVKQPDGGFEEGLINKVVDRVGADMIDELNYFKEASNGVEFEESLSFLGFVKTPKVLPQYSSDRVLVSEWVQGHHLDALPKEEGLAMTRMAVEACTASLVLTGYVHADPHEGNLMLDENGNVVFLDFGLMSDVSDNVMEAFARGIQACLSEDWVALTQAFKDTGFISDPILYRSDTKDEFRPLGFNPTTGEDLGMEKLSTELGKYMNEVEGGTSRFGALATVLNKKMSPRWKMATPPYILLLIRTFLTLEGIAGRVDPDFNIYEMAMPWAIRRSLSPSTREGIKTLRSTILTEDDRIQWNRLLELMESAAANGDVTEEHELQVTNGEGLSSTSAADGIYESTTKSSTESAKASAMNDAVVSLIGSPEGVVLRTVLKDLDSIDLLDKLLSKEGRPLRRRAIRAMSEKPLKTKDKKKMRKKPQTDALEQTNNNIITADSARPVSEACLKLRRRQTRWKNKVILCLVKKHLKQIFRAGPKSWAQSLYLAIRIFVGVLHQKAIRSMRNLKRRFRPLLATA